MRAGMSAGLFEAAAQAAAQGAEATRQFVSKFGRAKSYGTQTIGTPDAGVRIGGLFLPGDWLRAEPKADTAFSWEVGSSRL